MRQRSGVFLRALAVIMTVVLGAGCQGPTVAAIESDSLGVKLLTYAGDPEPLSWRLDTLRVLGGREGGPAGFYVIRRSLVDVDESGHIYVLDPSQYHVAVFDSLGKPMGVVGRKGQGPGELDFPVSVSASESGTIYVFDGAKRALVALRLDGSVPDQTPFPYSVINTSFPQFAASRSGIAF